MIFLGGVHGVGKSSFCNVVKRDLKVDTFTASALITQRKQELLSTDKWTPDPAANQQYLLEAVRELDTVYLNYLLDGHFCLLDAEGKIIRIPSDTFVALNPAALILLTDKPTVIADRRKRRDGIDHDATAISCFQEAEHSYAELIADMLSIPLKVSQGSPSLDNTLAFVRENLRRTNNGR